MSATAVVAGIVFSESVIHTPWFTAMSTFVAVNTMLYLTLAIFKIFPKLHVSDLIERRNRRGETRSIFPDGHEPDDEPPR